MLRTANITATVDKVSPTTTRRHDEDEVTRYKPIKVTLNFSQHDIDCTDELMGRFRTRSKGAAVSIALRLAKKMADYVDEGDEILVRTKDGQIRELVITGLD